MSRIVSVFDTNNGIDRYDAFGTPSLASTPQKESRRSPFWATTSTPLEAPRHGAS